MEKDIGKIKKNEMTDILIRIDDFGGKTGLTIREFTTSERYTGFTKSGTRIPAEYFKDFKQIINSINEHDLKPSAVVSNTKDHTVSTNSHSEKKIDKENEEEDEDIF